MQLNERHPWCALEAFSVVSEIKLLRQFLTASSDSVLEEYEIGGRHLIRPKINQFTFGT